MPNQRSSRRSLLRVISGCAAASVTVQSARAQEEHASAVPWSAGSKPPSTKAPAQAVDCHFHIYNSRYPFAPEAILKPSPATVADYRLLQKRLGTSRCVAVQPSSYGTDNRCLLEALREFGPAAARGIAVVNLSVSDTELKAMHEGGVRGIRFNLLQTGATTLNMIEPLSRRVAGMGWHVQVNTSPSQIAGAERLFSNLPCPIVFDHFGHAIPAGRKSPAFGAIVRLLKSGKDG